MIIVRGVLVIFICLMLNSIMGASSMYVGGRGKQMILNPIMSGIYVGAQAKQLSKILYYISQCLFVCLFVRYRFSRQPLNRLL